MGEFSDLSYCELRAKEIINTLDGRRLGRIIDIVFSGRGGEIKGIVVPYARRIVFSRNSEVFIPWECVKKIGEDVILVALIPTDGYQQRKRFERGNRRSYDCDGGGSRNREEYCSAYRAEERQCNDNDCDDNVVHVREREKNKHDECCDNEREEKHKSNYFKQYEYNYGGDPEDAHSKENHSDGSGERPNCDRKCEKCMLFDCAYRWKND